MRGTYFVEHLEGSEEFLVCEERLFAHGGDDELRVVDEARLVNVDGLEHLEDILLLHGLSEEFVVAIEDLLLGQLTIAIFVNGLENLREVLLLILCQKLTGNEGEGGLLELLVSAEVLQVGQGAHGNR